MAEFILPLEKLIEQFRKLPGIGRKTAVRLAFAVLDYTPEEADAFAAVSSGDNSNIISARVARETFGVERVVARIYDAKRAAVYGVPEEDLGKYYASRTLLKREVLPEHVANAVFVLCSADLSHTTGLHIPVDAGVAAAFLR